MLESDKGVRKMKRLYCNHEFRYYTQLKQVLLDLGLADQDYLWLISDFEAYPMKKEQHLSSLKHKRIDEHARSG